VELMLENYHRTLLLTSQQIAILRTRVQSAQEVFAINVDLYRNRVVRVPPLMPQSDPRALRDNHQGFSCLHGPARDSTTLFGFGSDY
jgi:hypothetical protein